jgi:hypothetical protein
MGNGASIFLNADLQNSLSQKSIQTFQDFENECIAQKLNAEQIYDLLVSKYEELLNFDSHKKTEPAPSTPSVDEKKDINQQPVRKNSIPKPKMNLPSWGTTVSAKKKHETRAKINSYYSQLHKKKSSTFPNESASCSESSSPENASTGKVLIETDKLSMEDNSRQSSDETVCFSRMDSMDSLTFNDSLDCSTVYIGEMGEDIDASPSLDHFEISVKTEPDRCEHFECKLCNKQFTGRWRLQKHLRYSEVHKQTLHALKEKFFDEAEGLNKLTKRAIQHFQESLSISHSYFEGNVNMNRLRWKKAIGKVVSSFISRKYESMVDQLQDSHNPFSFSRPLDDNKITLIHIDSKFFWRNKSRFLFHFYFHEVYNCIEIIPQLLPFSTVTIDGNGSEKENENENDVYLIQKEFLLNPNQRKKMESISPSPRFFVNFRVINKIIAQQTASRPVEETPIITEDQQSSQNGNNSNNNNSNSNNKSKTEGGDSGTNPFEIPILVSSVQSTELEICKFLLSKLKLDYSLIANNMLTEKAIYFESQHVMKNNQIIEINTMIPHGLKPVILPPFDGKKPPLYEQWEVKNKLHEIVSSHQELNSAVNKAEEISKSILLVSPRFLHCLSPLLSPTKRKANKTMLNNYKTSGSNSRIPIDSIYFPSSSVNV